MADKSYTVTYEGTTDRSKNISEAVEIGGHRLEQGKPVGGLSAAEVAQLQDGDEFKYHKFEVTEGEPVDALEAELNGLTKPELVQRGAELDPPLQLNEADSKPSLVQAVREAEEARQ
jgi:hypothetical protein